MEDDYKPIPPNYLLYTIILVVVLVVLWLAFVNRGIFLLTPQELQEHLRNSLEAKE